MRIRDLDKQIKQVCPIHGVDSNGRISFKDEATKKQREDARNIVKSFDWNAESEEDIKRTGMRNKIETLKAGNATPEQVQKILAYVLERLT